jgi:hypothetical protein
MFSWRDLSLWHQPVWPFYEKQELPRLRIRTDQRSEYCGRGDQHDAQLYMALNDIEHTKTKIRPSDLWLPRYNTQRTHQGKRCCGRVPMETLIDGKSI